MREKFVVILISLSLLASLQLVNATNIEWTSQPGAVPQFNKIKLQGSGMNWLGSASNLNDNNLGTYIGFGNPVPTGSPYWGEFEGIITFANTAPEITNVYYYLSGDMPNYRTGSSDISTFLLIGGTWNKIDSRGIPLSEAWGGVNLSGSWHNVNAVKVYVKTEISVFRDPENPPFFEHLSEIRASGPCVPSKTCADYPGQCGTGLSDGCSDILDCNNNCLDNICYTPNCNVGNCEETAVPAGQVDPGQCDSPNFCDGAGNCIFPSDVYWTDLNGNQITGASIGSTVWMIYAGKAGERYDFNIIEKDTINDDAIRTVPSSENFDYNSNLAAAWTISQADFDKGSDIGELLDGQEEFRFNVNGRESDDLIVLSDNYNNPLPTTIITNPRYQDAYVISQSTGKTIDIPFNQISSDPNDDLKLTWYFGEGNTEVFENIKRTGLGDTTHSYSDSGTKSIILTAEEMSPPRTASEVQSDSDATEIYVYGEGITVFAIITEPNPDELLETNSRFVKINASATHIVNCSYSQAECNTASNAVGMGNCYSETDGTNTIYCYNFPQSEQNKIKMEWTFDGNVNNKLIGYYSNQSVVEFIKIFDEPGRHTINLRASYTI